MVSSMSSFFATLSAVLVIAGVLVVIFDGVGGRSQPGDDVILAVSLLILSFFTFLASLFLKLLVWVF